MSFSSNPPLLVNQLPVSVEFPKEKESFDETLSILYKQIANTVNLKEGSLYSAIEYGNSQLFNITNPRFFKNGYRKCFDMVALNGGPIAAGATVSHAHGIVGIAEATRIWGAATNSDTPAKFIPLNYCSATLVTDQVQIYLTSTNVVLINGATQSILVSAKIFADYLKT